MVKGNGFEGHLENGYMVWCRERNGYDIGEFELCIDKVHAFNFLAY